jgi:putative ABC transport system permease protein
MVLSEGVLMLLFGGLIGLGLVALIVPGMAAASGGMVPIHGVAGQTWALGIGLMVVIGLIVGLVPAWRAMRLNIVDALSGR